MHDVGYGGIGGGDGIRHTILNLSKPTIDQRLRHMHKGLEPFENKTMKMKHEATDGAGRVQAASAAAKLRPGQCRGPGLGSSLRL